MGLGLSSNVIYSSATSGDLSSSVDVGNSVSGNVSTCSGLLHANVTKANKAMESTVRMDLIRRCSPHLALNRDPSEYEMTKVGLNCQLEGRTPPNTRDQSSLGCINHSNVPLSRSGPTHYMAR